MSKNEISYFESSAKEAINVEQDFQTFAKNAKTLLAVSFQYRQREAIGLIHFRQHNYTVVRKGDYEASEAIEDATNQTSLLTLAEFTGP